MISVNNSLTARKCYSSREYFHPLGCIKRFKWIFRKVLVVHCFRCQIAKKLSYCQKVIIILPKIACCTKEHFARHHTSRKMFSFLLCLQSGNVFYSYFEFPSFKCLSINFFQHPPRLSQFCHLKTLQRKQASK